jgi:signal transduction histidine kinase
MASLRTSAAYRIAFTFAAAVAAAIVVLGVAVYFVADAEFRQQRDQAITDEISDLAQEGGRPQLLHEIAGREAERTTESFGYAVFDRSGKKIGGALDTARPSPGFSMIIFHDPVEGPDLARAKTVDLPNGDRLVVAIDSETVESIDATILSLFGGAFVVLLIVSVIGALLLGRYLRDRLGTISTTAHAIVAGDLTHRMPIGPHRDEFDTVAMALNAMLDRIVNLMENLRQVSSDVAHDLRTPLLRLRGQLEQVGTVEGAAQRAIEQGDEVLKLFASILRIAEVESGGLEQGFRPIDLSALVEDVADGFLPALTDSGRVLNWQVEPDVVVQGDRELLAQAIANLLDNVRAHTPAGTRAMVTLEANGERVTLSVADSGPGVSPSDRDRILRRFYRGEASRTTPGNGLGLSLVTAVATAHGGEVEVDGNGPGLRVTISLPKPSH